MAPPKVKSQLEKADESRTFAELQSDAVFFLGPKSQAKLKNEDAIKPDQKSRQTVFRVRCSSFLWAPSYIIRTIITNVTVCAPGPTDAKMTSWSHRCPNLSALLKPQSQNPEGAEGRVVLK